MQPYPVPTNTECKPAVEPSSVHGSYGSKFDVCTFNPASEWPVGCLLTGSHAPVAPVVLANIHEDLAGRIAEDLPGPMLVLGVAGRSDVLANGILSEFRRRSRRDDVTSIILSSQSDLAGVVAASRGVRGREVPRSVVLALDEIHEADDIEGVRRVVRLSGRGSQELVVVSTCDWTENDTILSIVSGPPGRMRTFANDNLSKDVVRVPFAPDERLRAIPGSSARLPVSLSEMALSIRPRERVCVVHSGVDAWTTYLAAARLERMVMRKAGSVRFLQSRLSRDGSFSCLPSRERIDCDRLVVVTENARSSPIPCDLHLDLLELSKGN